MNINTKTCLGTPHKKVDVQRLQMLQYNETMFKVQHLPSIQKNINIFRQNPKICAKRSKKCLKCEHGRLLSW